MMTATKEQQAMTTHTTTTTLTVCDRAIQIDRSGGQGHCWRHVADHELTADVRTEIEGEILDGGRESCDDYRASNGLHYRWTA